MAANDATITLDQFLASLGDGLIHSSGAFTISEEAARDKLARYTLAHPALYVLELIGAAVLGRATFFQVTTLRGGLQYRFDGEPLTSEDCHKALGQLFVSASSRRLSCLGLGLLAAFQTAKSELGLTLADGTFDFDGEGFRSIPSQPERLSASATEITVPGRYGFLTGFVSRDATLQEALNLAACAPLQLTLDGEEISTGWRPGYFRKVGAALHWHNNRFPLTWGCPKVNPFFVLPAPGDFSAMFALMPAEEATKAALTVVHQGVSYRATDPEFPPPCVGVAVMADGLERNLSRSAIIQNDTYQSLRQCLLTGIEILIWAALDTPYRFTPQLQACKPAVLWAMERYRTRTGAEHSQGVSWLAILARISNNSTPQTLVDLAEEQNRLGNGRKAEDFRLAAIELLLEKFRQSGRARNLESALPTWLPLLRNLVVGLNDSDRKGLFSDFLALAEPWKTAPNATVGQRLHSYRCQGLPAKAVELLPLWTERPFEFSYHVPAELWLALPRTSNALTYLLRNAESQDVDVALSKPWRTADRGELELLADALEYRDDLRALLARQMCVDLADGVEMRYLHSLEMCRHARARGKLALWAKFRAIASFLSVARDMTTVDLLHKEHPLVGSILQGKADIPEDLDGFLLPLMDKLGFHNQVLPFLIGRLAHRLRLKNSYRLADQLMARCYTLRAMDRLLWEL